MRWINEKPPCESCKLIHSRKGNDPPCDTCRVDLLDENVDIVRVYSAAKNQVRAIQTMEGYHPIDLDVPSVKIIMDLYNIQDQLTCFEKVRALFFKMQEEKGNK